MDLVMENLKLRVKASQAGAISRPLSQSGDLPTGRPTLQGVFSSGSGAASTWSSRALPSRSATPVPRSLSVSATSCAPSLGQMAVRTATVGTLRAGASSVQQPLLVTRSSRSESPNPRAAWAASVDAFGKFGQLSMAQTPLSPPISPRIASCRVPLAPAMTVAALRHATPIPGGRHPQLSSVSAGSSSLPAGLVMTPRGSNNASLAHLSSNCQILGSSSNVAPAMPMEPWQSAPSIVGSRAAQLAFAPPVLAGASIV